MTEVSTNPFVEAFQAGLSPIPVDTQTKRPKVAWKTFQETPAELLVLQEWAGSNIGVICGEVSGRLYCIDIEGVFDRASEAADSLERCGVAEVFARWCDGYMESTPSGGRHVLVRVEGSGPLEGNRKLASSSEGKTLIETRGEGGYVIVAPSRNGQAGWVRLRGGFDTIAWATLAEWERVVDALVALDESPAQPQPVENPKAGVSLTPPMLRLGSSWIDDELARLPAIEAVLEDHGWQPASSHDSYGQHWVRPGKEVREGHSASVSTNGRLYVHSSNAGLETGNPTHDALDVILFYALGHRPSLDERTEWLKAQRPAAERDAGAGPDRAGEVAELNLPSSFWSSRPYLEHIRQAALSRRLSPDAVWAGVKCFYAATIPPNHRLPRDGTLDYISMMVGNSGAGKSSAKQEAYNLLEWLHNIPGVVFPVPPGSGEGMAEFFLDRTDSEAKYRFRGVGYYADEGRWLLDVNSRAGNTTVQALKQMWSGELTGSVAATSDRHRWLAPRDVRATCLIGATPDVASEFLRRDLSDEGLPQRISWSWAHYPHPDSKPEHPGPLELPVWKMTGGGPYEVELDGDLAGMLDERQLAASRGEGTGLEGHSTYATLKGAAILAHLDGRMAVNMQDWEMSVSETNVSARIRNFLVSNSEAGSQNRNTALGTARAHQKLAESSVYMERAMISLANKLRSLKEPLTTRQIKDHLRPFKQRHGIDHREVIELIIGRGLAVPTEGGIRGS